MAEFSSSFFSAIADVWLPGIAFEPRLMDRLNRPF